ncbi:Type cbb3 cytochrome oxidase biogenesis protein CcoH [Sphingobium indicum BiD32]|uniref:Type cbb3 cytochrome oxidase biogenesis protein CcoH n=2 Tax=Sphingobium indicum TaxID=332055 RepID=N1MNF9_9SPHN|nr:Type cbb3 cytochrome oxidase biogenesis protein CcoH [Sphingobium indicum BiD32]
MSSFRLNGRHVAAIFVSFFAVVIAVNVLMASYAVGGFGGTVVDNSYVASQRFNDWLAMARRQDALGWRQETRLDAGRHLVLTLVGPSATPTSVSATAEHPLGRAADIPLRFEAQADGHWRAVTPLPAGRWIIHWTVQADGQDMRFLERNG